MPGLRLSAVIAAIACCISVTGCQTVLDPEEARQSGVNQYATSYNVSLEEAQRRIDKQSEIIKVHQSIQQTEAATFAGLYIEHQPKYRVVARFTEAPEEALRRHTDDPEFEAVLAEKTLPELQEQREVLESQFREFDIEASVGMRIQDGGKILVEVLDESRFNESVQSAQIELTENVIVREIQAFISLTGDICGGKEAKSTAASSVCPLYASATTGFSVVHSSGTRGIATAGHLCDTQLKAAGKSVSLQGQMNTGPYDIQWMTSPSHTFKNTIDVSSGERVIKYMMPTSGKTIGLHVCKYGLVTKEDCGPIVDLNYVHQSTDTPEYNGGVYIRVEHPQLKKMSESGDSGGPFWNNQTAYGIMHGKIEVSSSQYDAVYMPVELFSDLDLTVGN